MSYKKPHAAAHAAAKSLSSIRLVHSVPLRHVAGVTDFEVKYAKWHAYPPTSGRFSPQSKTLHHMVSQEAYDTRTDPLWLCCMARKDIGFNKRVVRSWAVRRTKAAIAESLKKEGFATNGTRLNTETRGKDLYGSAHIYPRPSIIKTSQTDLVKQTDLIVQAFMAFQRSKSKESEQMPSEKEAAADMDM